MVLALPALSDKIEPEPFLQITALKRPGLYIQNVSKPGSQTSLNLAKNFTPFLFLVNLPLVSIYMASLKALDSELPTWHHLLWPALSLTAAFLSLVTASHSGHTSTCSDTCTGWLQVTQSPFKI